MVSEDIKLVQASFLKGRQTVSLSDKGVVLKEGGKLAGSEQMFPYDLIAEDAIIVKDASKSWATVAVLFLVICMVFGTINIVEGDPYALWNILLWLILASLSFMIFLFSRVKYTIYVTSVGNLVLYTDKPSKDEFCAFLTELDARRLRYVEDKYSIKTSDESVVERLIQLTYLKDKGEISQTEFDSLKRDVIGNTNEGPASRGNFLN